MFAKNIKEYLLGNQTSSPLGRLGGEFICLLLLLVSCQDDTSSFIDPTPADRDGITINLSVEQPTETGNASTRANYEDGTAEEMMHDWTILVVRNDSIKKIFTSQEYDGTRQADSVYTRLENGTYSFYSFANLPLDSLGLSTASTTLPQGFDSLEVTVNGNQQNISGFPNGIPMSNKQTVTVTSTTSRIDLSVVRMLAKMRIAATNTSADSMRVTGISLTDITRNGKNNVRLLPGAITDQSTGKRAANLSSMIGDDDPQHKQTFEYRVPRDIQLLNAGETRNYEFYINESQARSSLNHFVISIETGNSYRNTATSRDTTVVRQRYAIVDWNNIARNEIHALPIGLRRYRIEFYIRPFTAIGVLPKYDMESEIASVDFGLYGHYDIVPRIRDLVTGNYYYIQNYTDEQNVTVCSTNPNRRTTDMTIDSLKLVTDSREIGIPYDMGGWGNGADGSGETKHYPTVGWNTTALTPRIECLVGNYTGWAIYTVNASFSVPGQPEPIFLSRRFRISNTYVDLSELAKRHQWF